MSSSITGKAEEHPHPAAASDAPARMLGLVRDAARWWRKNKQREARSALPGRRSARRWDRFHASPVWDKPKPARCCCCCCCCCRRRRSVMRSTEARAPVVWPSSPLRRWTEWPWMNVGVTRCRKRGDGAPRLQHANFPKPTTAKTRFLILMRQASLLEGQRETSVEAH